MIETEHLLRTSGPYAELAGSFPNPTYRQAEALATRRGMTSRQLFTEALEEELRRCAVEDSSREAPWMAGFGALSDLASENRRVLGVIEEEFGTPAPDDDA